MYNDNLRTRNDNDTNKRNNTQILNTFGCFLATLSFRDDKAYAVAMLQMYKKDSALLECCLRSEVLF